MLDKVKERQRAFASYHNSVRMVSAQFILAPGAVESPFSDLGSLWGFPVEERSVTVGPPQKSVADQLQDLRAELRALSDHVLDLRNLVQECIDIMLQAEDQTWFWTPAWQASEKRAKEELAAGQFRRISSAEELSAFFRSLDDQSAE